MDLRRITDFDAPELDVYARLTENQLLNRADPQNALFVAESPLVIGRALDAGCAPVSFLMETKHVTGKGAALLARCPGVPVYAAEEDVLTNLTGFHLTRGMLCAMRRPPLADPAAVLRGATRVAVLENVMNPTNLGAIFRSAAALGMDAVLLTSAGSDPLYRRAIRVSMGTVFQVPWAYVPEDWPALLRAQGFRTAAMALRDDSVRLDDPRLTQAEKLSREGLPEADFLRMKRSALGRRIRGLDSFDATCFRVCAYHFSDFDYFRFPEAYRQITSEEILSFLRRVVTRERSCLSIVEPVCEGDE